MYMYKTWLCPKKTIAALCFSLVKHLLFSCYIYIIRYNSTCSVETSIVHICSKFTFSFFNSSFVLLKYFRSNFMLWIIHFVMLTCNILPGKRMNVLIANFWSSGQLPPPPWSLNFSPYRNPNCNNMIFTWKIAMLPMFKPYANRHR